MSKRWKTVLMIALPVIAVAAIALAVVFLGGRRDKMPRPETVSVYLKDKGEIVVMPYAEFIRGCVFGLVSPKYEREALKAVAVAENTLALYRLSEKRGFVNSGADFTAGRGTEFPYLSESEIRAAYGDSADKYLQKVSEALALDEAVLYDGAPILAAMCEISTGRLDDGGLPYLAAVDSPYDARARGYESVSTFTASFVLNALSEHIAAGSLPRDPAEWFHDAEYYDSGTLKSVMFGSNAISGEELRKALGLRSAAIYADYSEERLRFICRGCGGNIGMSVYGANAMALKGASAEEILLHYYSETSVYGA